MVKRDVQATVADMLRVERELHEITDLRQGKNNTSNKSLNTNRGRGKPAKFVIKKST